MTRKNIIQVQKWPHKHTPTEDELRQLMEQMGLSPYRWSDVPGAIYHEHTHDYEKVLYVVSGSITFGFPIVGEPTVLQAGDRLELPAGIRHNAVVGPEGVVCLEARR